MTQHAAVGHRVKEYQCIRWPRWRKKGCLWKATWIIGTAGVPYCEYCASTYQRKVGNIDIPRHRIAQPDNLSL